MTDKIFFLFPGQGAQCTGMALDLLESSTRGDGKVKKLFTMASKITGIDMAALLANPDTENLKKSDISQPAITLANLSAAAYLEERGIKPSGCAGFSLGEYAALAVAGLISEEDCFFLVRERGKAMQAAADRIREDETSSPGMAAVLGLSPEKVEALIGKWRASGKPNSKDIYAANINSPKQTVVSGTAKALAEAEVLFKTAGAKRFVRLQVAGPFHSPLMAEAARKFKPSLEKVQFRNPQIPLFSNVTGKRVYSGEEAKKLAMAQITEAVCWTDEEVAIMASRGIDCLLEAGPGRVLQGLWKDTNSSLPCYAAGTVADIDKLFL